MKFRSPTDQPMHLALVTGHTAVVSPEGNELPDIFHREAIANGCLPEGVSAAVPNPGTGPTRKEVITKAINEMLDGKDAEDFKADGTINVRRLSARVGFTVPRDEAEALFAAATAEADS